MKSRRSFIQKSLAALAAVTILPDLNTFAKESAPISRRTKAAGKLRFALASDGHYGQANTDSDKFYADIIKWLNKEHAANHLDFVIFNGDLVHNDYKLLSVIKSKYFKDLKVPYYAVPGNHDLATNEQWKEVFGYDENHSFVKNDIAFVTAHTSNVKGEYVSPDNDFLKTELDKFKDKKTVFVVLHVPPHRWLPEELYFVSFPETVKLLHQYPNVKAVFHGHDHSLDGIRYVDKMPHFFDGHFGGNWGTDYKGYRIVEVSDADEILTYQVNASKNPQINLTKIK